MRHLAFITILLLCCLFSYAQSASPPAKRSSMNLSVVGITSDNNTIHINFNLASSGITITIEDEDKVVYRNTTDVVPGSNLVINTNRWNSLTYIIRITGNEGLIKEVFYYRE